MKKMLYLLLSVCVVLTSSAFGMVFAQAAETPQEASADKTEERQTASAYLDQSEDIVVAVTADLSGGWSVEFARGAVYLYDGEITEGKDCAAMLITLDAEVYGEYLEEAMADEDHEEADGGVYFPFFEDEDAYLTSLEDSAFILITASADTDIEAVVSRFELAAEPGDIPAAEWPRDGYFLDENENMLSITWMDDIDEPGWYVGCMLGEDSWGGTLPLLGDALQGELSNYEEKDPLTVTVTEEADGILLAVEGGDAYHFTPLELPDASIFVTINTEGWGMIGYEEGEIEPELDPEWPYQSAQINLAEAETYTFAAAPEAGSMFVKWTKNGEDFSTEPVITVLLDESADFVAVFEEDPGWQNPVMNFIGEYQCDRAHALVECFGNEDAWITIEWGGSASELARWDIVGRLDTETLTIEYSDCTKSIVVYDENGEIESQEPEYEDGTGTIGFHDDGTFTWHEDQSEYGEDMVFEWLPVEAAGD